MKKTKLVVNYLPQFHCIPQNDMWWGKGYTDWCAVKKAVPLFEEHEEPRTPLNNNYYSLDDVRAIRWQAALAKKYGIYGFAIYHYWFSTDLKLLEKPAEIILENKDIDLNYCFLWDNATWKRTWSNVRHANDWSPEFDASVSMDKEKSGILAELIYGSEEDWLVHFRYLLQFFKDDRYIKIDNKPVFGIFQPTNDYFRLKKMIDFWNKLAINNGFKGLLIMGRDNYRKLYFDNTFRYTPLVPLTICDYIKSKIMNYEAKKNGHISFFDYDKCWESILKAARNSNRNTFLSGFVGFDDSPRRGKKARIILGQTPDKFEKYMKELLRISRIQGKEFVFLTAWNEWGEGAYLEPDTKNGYAYLEALKRAIDSVDSENA